MCHQCAHGECSPPTLLSTLSLQAANGPLQQRGVTLDLDTSRANHLPDDYDTDLESPWSNPSRFTHPPGSPHLSVSV